MFRDDVVALSGNWLTGLSVVDSASPQGKKMSDEVEILLNAISHLVVAIEPGVDNEDQHHQDADTRQSQNDDGQHGRGLQETRCGIHALVAFLHALQTVEVAAKTTKFTP